MPPVVADPNRLTKEQLKRELSENGVDLPPSHAKKNVYVELYRQHILQSNSDRIGLSSDEEDNPESVHLDKRKSHSPRKYTIKNESHNMDEIDVQSLSDEELREQLGSYNVECGPILASTRRVYEKKLLKVLSGEVTSEPSGTTDFVDYSDDYDEEPVDDEVTGGETAVAGVRYTQHVRDAKYLEPTVQESKFSQERSEAIRQRVMLDPEPNWKGASQKLSRDDIHSTSYSRISRYTSSSLASSKPSAMSTLTRVRQSQGQPPADMKKKKGLSIWVQLIIVVIIALIIFMVFQNLEPANILPTHYIDNSN